MMLGLFVALLKNGAANLRVKIATPRSVTERQVEHTVVEAAHTKPPAIAMRCWHEDAKRLSPEGVAARA
jgi:uncharacterized Zn finger protein